MDSNKTSNGLVIATPSHQLMFELFYPAVLGSLFYNLLPLLWDVLSGARLSEEYALWKLLLAVLIVFNFATDFLLAKAIRDYTSVTFLIDIVVLFLLFKAFDSINVSDSDAWISARSFCLSYCGTFMCFLLWAICKWKEHGRPWHLVCFEIVVIAWFAILSWFLPDADRPATLRELCVLAGSVLIVTIALHPVVTWAKPRFLSSSA